MTGKKAPRVQFSATVRLYAGAGQGRVPCATTATFQIRRMPRLRLPVGALGGAANYPKLRRCPGRNWSARNPIQFVGNGSSSWRTHHENAGRHAQQRPDDDHAHCAGLNAAPVPGTLAGRGFAGTQSDINEARREHSTACPAQLGQGPKRGRGQARSKGTDQPAWRARAGGNGNAPILARAFGDADEPPTTEKTCTSTI